jgi:hypothetical protein
MQKILQNAKNVINLWLLSRRYKNILGRGSASSRHITKLEQSTFLLNIYDSNMIQDNQSFIRGCQVVSKAT